MNQNDCETHLFLDLEGTVITPVLDGWHNTEILNLDKIKDVIWKEQPLTVSIFSFALHNEFDLSAFNCRIRLELERELGVDFARVPLVRDIKSEVCSIKRLHPNKVDLDDLSSFFGKHDSFRLFVRSLTNTPHPRNIHRKFILMDDTVFNETWNWPDRNVSGEIVHVPFFE